jgi:hypothetical protein
MRYILILLTLFCLFNSLKPDYIRINEVEVRACTIAQQADPDFICD